VFRGLPQNRDTSYAIALAPVRFARTSGWRTRSRRHHLSTVVRYENNAAPARLEPTKNQERGNGAYRVIVRHDLFEIERIEELPLIMVDLPHRHPPSPMFASRRRNHCSPVTSSHFCNKIGPLLRNRGPCFLSAFARIAEVRRPSTEACMRDAIECVSNEFSLWRAPLESVEVRLCFRGALKNMRGNAALFQRLAELHPQETAGRVARDAVIEPVH
jgi:hypothetical protein